jgi:hypothetical protein
VKNFLPGADKSSNTASTLRKPRYSAKMFSTSKALSSRPVISKLEVERKFVPSPLLKKYASDTATTPRIRVNPAAVHSPSVVLERLPRKRITDKYFDYKGQLEQKGI